jgi:hypothetical protein
MEMTHMLLFHLFVGGIYIGYMNVYIIKLPKHTVMV